MGPRGLDFGTHNESLRPHPKLMGGNRAGHLTSRGNYRKSPSHSGSLVPLKVVYLGGHVSLTLMRIAGDQVKSSPLSRRDIPVFLFSQELLQVPLLNCCETFDVGWRTAA